MPKQWTKCSAKSQFTQKELTDMAIFTSLVKKESLHIVRDTRTMVITLVMPLILLLLFGFAISTEVNDIRLIAVTDQHNDQTREIIERFCVNDYFTFQGIVSPGNVEPLLRSGKSDAAVYLKDNDGQPTFQIVADASNTATAQTVTGYIEGVIAGTGANQPVVSHTLYNPQMKSAYNFVPGIMGMIFILICSIMTSVSIVREKETGTMDLLLVSPVRSATVIAGKLVPYFVLSCAILAVMLTIAYTVLGLPFSGSVVNVVAVSVLYITLSLSVGILVSAIAHSQLTALMVSAVLFMLPVIMLSGMIFPIDNMPSLLQWISCAIPARWYTEAMRKLMIQQLDLSYVIKELCILASMTLVLLTVSIKLFHTR